MSLRKPFSSNEPRDETPQLAARGGLTFAVVIALAAAIRLLLLFQLPAISRDGCAFCWYAESLGEQGVSYLRAAETKQHPLYPLLVLASHRLAIGLGALEGPWAWQRSGQAVSFIAGMLVVVLSGAIASSLVKRLALPVSPRSVRNSAMLLAALLPLNAQLSANVMSDQVFLAFFLASVWLLVGGGSDGLAKAMWAGILAGLAFLTRPEGATLPLAAVLTALIGALRGKHRSLLPGLAVLIAFAIVASPYWLVVGKFSAKKDLTPGEDRTASMQRFSYPVLDASERKSNPLQERPTAFAKLERTDYSLAAVGFVTLYTLFRTGRVVVPLLALFALAVLRRRWFDSPMLVVLLVLLLHLGAASWLLHKHDYQDQRHLLPAVALLIPFAAMALARVQQLARERRQPALFGIAAALVYVPLLWYTLRMPNAFDGYLVTAANRLREMDPQIASKSVMSGSGGRRLAFYSDARWLYWPEDPNNDGTLAWQFETLRPDYFAVEVGPGFETAGNAEMLDRLDGDPRFGLQEQFRLPGIPGRELRVFSVHR